MEVVRELKNLDYAAQMKMRSIRNLFTYYLYIVLLHVVADIDKADAPKPTEDGQPPPVEVEGRVRHGTFLLKQLRRIFHAFRLVAGFSVVRPDPSRCEQAQSIIEDFLQDMLDRFGDLWAKFTAHNLAHLIEDMIYFDCHLDMNSAYSYENYHQHYNKKIKPGAKADAQLL
jgi:hypothetical protein